MSFSSWAKRKAKNELKKRLKNAAIAAVKSFLKTYIAMFGAVGILILIIIIMFSAIYIQFTGGQAAYGLEDMDEQYRKYTKEYTVYTNTINVYMEDGKHLPRNEAYHLVYEVGDYFNFTKDQILTEGDLASGVLFFSYGTGTSIEKENNFKEVDEKYFKEIAEDLSPVLTYRLQRLDMYYQTIEYDDKGKPKVVEHQDYTTTYLLIRSNNIEGDKIYNYKIVWKEAITVDPATGIKLVSRSQVPELESVTLQTPIYYKLDQFLVKKLGVKPDDVEFDRRMFLEGSRGYNMIEERLAWLMEDSPYGSGFYISTADIPPYLWDIIHAIAEKYNIPWWFIAAVINKESSFRLTAENPSSGAWGLMQVMPENWEHYTKVLGYDPEKDKLNPWAQIEVGTYLLKQYLGNIDWDSPDWKEQTLKGLAFYGGYRGPDALERCRGEYASAIWTYADAFKDNTPIWPAPGNYTITSTFGIRNDPLTGESRFHEGIDIGGKIGDPLVAAANGKIVYAGWAEGYGLTVVIRTPTHDFLYGHMSKIYVSVNQTVTKGQKIGEIGSTGRSTGPHLHFGVSVGSWTDKNWIDPLTVIRKPQ